VQGEDSARTGGRRGSKAYLAASFGAQACALLRYIILARLLGPEQLGIAVALILTAQFFESVTESGGDKFLVQDGQGDEPAVQKMVHLVWLLRGLLVAVTLVVLSLPLARFYGQPELVTGFLILAVSPLIAGLAHLDYRRMQRTSDFRGESRVLLASELASLLVTGVAAWLIRDYTAILFGLITRSAIIVLVSHLTAERRYGAGYAPEHARRLSAFAVPLLVNGLLLFLGAQGDRLLIGSQLGLAELGHYSAALLLIFYPSGMLQRFLTAMHMPLISGAGDRQGRPAAADRLGGQTLLLAAAMMLGYFALAPIFVVLLFGPDFALPLTTLALISFLQGLRFLRLWPVTASLAIGRSGLVLASNVLRLVSFALALALPLVFPGHALGLDAILAAFALGEFLALIATLPLVNKALEQKLSAGMGRIMLFSLLGLASVGLAVAAGEPASRWLIILGLTAFVIALVLAVRERATLKEGLALLKTR
jgi:O-antigen/teichoic acid export membrane protein